MDSSSNSSKTSKISEKRSTRRINTEDTSSGPNDGSLAYRLTIAQVLDKYKTLRDGLSLARAKEIIDSVGPNSLGDDAKISYSKIVAHQVFNAMILVLIISMIIALAIQDWISGGVIGFVVLINIGVGFVQEVKAEKTMGSLRSLSSPTARVTRDGDDQTIPAQEVVPGDIVHIKVGDTVPADLRLIESMNLEADEALLTGESLPVQKDENEVYADPTVPIPVGDRLNLAYSSSVVSKGRGTGVAIGTGLDTEIGKIALSLRGNNSLIRKVEKSEDHSPKKREYAHAFFGTIKDVLEELEEESIMLDMCD